VQLVVAPVTERGLPDRRRLSGKQRVTSNGLPSFQNVIAGAHQLVRQRLGSDDVVGPGLLAFVERLASGQKRLAKFAASMNAQARYLLPFLTLPSPFFLRLLVCTLSTQRAYDAKLPTSANRSIGPFSRRMTVASVCDARHAGQQAVLRSGLAASTWMNFSWMLVL
jgi:hypothetical protein